MCCMIQNHSFLKVFLALHFLTLASLTPKSCEKISHVANICQHSQSGYQAKACEQKWIRRMNRRDRVSKTEDYNQQDFILRFGSFNQDKINQKFRFLSEIYITILEPHPHKYSMVSNDSGQQKKTSAFWCSCRPTRPIECNSASLVG